MTEQREGAPLLVAIDGPAGAGKSTVAAALARRLGLPYLDTGAMYRAVGLLALRAGLAPPFSAEARKTVEDLVSAHQITVRPEGDQVRVWLDGEDVSDAIRTPSCAMMASAVSVLAAVRRALVPAQRRLAFASGGVMEGRDIGSVVLPDAVLKVFLTASPGVRARRRHDEMNARGVSISLDEVHEQQRLRDLQDSSRQDSPLTVAPGAVVLDTSGMTVAEVVDRLVEELRRTSGERLTGAVGTP